MSTPLVFQPLAPVYRFSAMRHNNRANRNAVAPTAAAPNPMSGDTRPVSVDAGTVVAQAIGRR
ncbi:MAG TPA: hypothetical protein VKB63_12920 [Gemmatimonadales bacterium]|nr:hypothetical protein [Gemmatimonadales bacterium]